MLQESAEGEQSVAEVWMQSGRQTDYCGEIVTCLGPVARRKLKRHAAPALHNSDQGCGGMIESARGGAPCISAVNLRTVLKLEGNAQAHASVQKYRSYRPRTDIQHYTLQRHEGSGCSADKQLRAARGWQTDTGRNDGARMADDFFVRCRRRRPPRPPRPQSTAPACADPSLGVNISLTVSTDVGRCGVGGVACLSGVL